MKISKKVKSELYKVLYKELFFNDRDWVDYFLNEIWDLKAMPSEDDRFPDDYGDIIQHMINNSDWEMDYLFLESSFF